MKLDTDYYVRTTYHIRRITKIENDFVCLDVIVKDSLNRIYDRVFIKDVDKYFIKISSKLSDVLKVGDIVNGYRVLNIVTDEKGCVLFVNSKRGYIKMHEINDIITKEFYEKERYIIGK